MKQYNLATQLAWLREEATREFNMGKACIESPNISPEDKMETREVCQERVDMLKSIEHTLVNSMDFRTREELDAPETKRGFRDSFFIILAGALFAAGIIVIAFMIWNLKCPCV